MFDVSGIQKRSKIPIHKNFRLTCNIEKITQISSVFVKRFDVIILGDQSEDLSLEEKKELIKFLLINAIYQK